jgi:hypothetical protein
MMWRVFQAAIVLAVLGGCTTWPSTPLHKPFFRLDPAEAKWIPALIRKYEPALAKCQEAGSCDHVYFVRALVGLYESREVAESYFEKVIAISPKSQLAVSSKLWIQLLQEHPAPASISWLDAVFAAPVIANTNASLSKTAERLVRELLGREGVILQLRSLKEDDEQMTDVLQRELADRERKIESLSKKAESVSVQSLQKQLAERDRKIEDLSAQLEALKRIDQEMRDKVRPIRPPSTTAPPPVADINP